MSMDMITAFAEQMARLRQAIADADSLAASAETLPAATAVGESFASAREAERARFLLRALDDAITAQEVAARLADELHGVGILEQPREPVGGETDPLLAAYQAYAESQPVYAALYLYRNALALRLRVAARPTPGAVAPSPPPAADAAGADNPPARPDQTLKETDR
jgi:hypothetical protein